MLVEGPLNALKRSMVQFARPRAYAPERHSYSMPVGNGGATSYGSSRVPHKPMMDQPALGESPKPSGKRVGARRVAASSPDRNGGLRRVGGDGGCGTSTDNGITVRYESRVASLVYS